MYSTYFDNTNLFTAPTHCAHVFYISRNEYRQYDPVRVNRLGIVMEF